MNKKRLVIAGTGFRGFCDAIELAKIPNTEITLIEPAPFFGGVMNSFEINGFHVDKGVHIFDSIPKDLAAIISEIMDGQVGEIGFVSASAFNGKVTDGFSLPDLNSIDDFELKSRIKKELQELIHLKGNLTPPQNLHEVFEHRYGATAARIFSKIFHKVYGISSAEIEPSGMAQTSMGRMKFLDDPEMLELKKSDEWLDTVLAARRKTVGKVDDYVSIYPIDGRAMKGWCERAKIWLEKKGINVLLGEKILKLENHGESILINTDKRKVEADKLIWSNDNVSALGKAVGIDMTEINELQHATPMLFITLMTHKNKIKDFTYLQNFDPDGLTYRTAATGIFSQQTRNGISFITSECPAEINGEYWNDPKKAVAKTWEEIKKFKIVDEDAELVDSHVLQLPVTFKLAKLNYTKKFYEFEKKLKRTNPNILIRSSVPFFRRDIYFDSLKLRDLI